MQVSDTEQETSSLLSVGDGLLMEYQDTFEALLDLIDLPNDTQITENTHQKNEGSNVSTFLVNSKGSSQDLLENNTISKKESETKDASLLEPVTEKVAFISKSEGTLNKYHDSSFHDRLPDYYTCTAYHDQPKVVDSSLTRISFYPRSPECSSTQNNDKSAMSDVALPKFTNQNDNDLNNNKKFYFSVFSHYEERFTKKLRRNPDEIVILIENLTLENSYQSLLDIFEVYGQVKELFIKTNHFECGYVQFSEYRSLLDVIANRKLDPSLAKLKLRIGSKPQH